MMKTLVTSLALFLAAQFVLAQESVEITTGAGNTTQVWYSLEDGTSTSASLEDWDLAFSISGISSTFHVNTAKGMHVWVYDGEVTDFEKLDTTGLADWTELNNSDTSWAYGAFSNAADLSDPFDLGWGVYDMNTHQVKGDRIFVVKLTDDSYQKIMIEKLASGTYYLRHASIDNQMDMTHELKKADFEGKNFGYFNLSTHETLDLEPTANKWDLLFTKYTTLIQAGPSVIPYGVAGALTNAGVQSVKVYPVDDPANFNDYSQTFGTEINTIGYDWKTYNFNESKYIIADSTVYLVKTWSGNVWKVVMTGYSGSADGKMTFNKTLVYSVGIDEKPAENHVFVYPNPVVGDEINLVAIGEIATSNAQVEIRDINGKLVKASTVNLANQVQINVADVQSGIYFISIVASDKSIVQKIILN